LIDLIGRYPVRLTTDQPGILGFRGFIVEPDLEDGAWRENLPPQFALAGTREPTLPIAHRQRATFHVSPSEDSEAAAVEFLLQLAEEVVDRKLIDACRDGGKISSAKVKAQTVPDKKRRSQTAPRIQPVLEGAQCDPFLAPMRFEFWNDPPVLHRNNCYNYATNFASNTMAQPGRRAGHMYTDFDCAAILQAARADGCLISCDGSVRVIALAVWPGIDFHWWRMHPDGTWAHKLGWMTARNWDNRGRILEKGLTPATCDRGPYTLFCGYYYAPLGMWVL
jgi:hypothetical protein